MAGEIAPDKAAGVWKNSFVVWVLSESILFGHSAIGQQPVVRWWRFRDAIPNTSSERVFLLRRFVFDDLVAGMLLMIYHRLIIRNRKTISRLLRPKRASVHFLIWVLLR